MTRFVTSYHVSAVRRRGRRFASEIVASSREHAKYLAARRGLGETIDGVSEPDFAALGIATLLDDWPEHDETPSSMAAAIHEACFLCFVGLKAGVLSLDETLGDWGLVHQLAHAAAGDPDITRERRAEILELAASIERRVPGWPCNLQPGDRNG